MLGVTIGFSCQLGMQCTYPLVFEGVAQILCQSARSQMGNAGLEDAGPLDRADVEGRYAEDHEDDQSRHHRPDSETEQRRERA